MSTLPVSRRDAFTGFSAAAILAGLTTPVFSNPTAIENYRLVMARRDAANASPLGADVERWCDEEAAAIAHLASSPGGMRDLLAKVIIFAERAQDSGFSLMDEEQDLLNAVRSQAEAMLQVIGGGA
jgi:hypothetical protein